MPNKTIYVSEEDLPYFEKAPELLKQSLSQIIAECVRRKVERAEAKRDRTQPRNE